VARGGAHLSPVTLSEIEQAAARNGYPADAEPRGDWLLLRSPWTAHGLLATHDGTRFLVAPLSPTVAEEVARERPALPGAPQGTAAVFAAATLRLHGVPATALTKEDERQSPVTRCHDPGASAGAGG